MTDEPTYIKLRKVAADIMALGAKLIEVADDLEHAASLDDADLVALARAIQGEGAALFGTQRERAGLMIAHCALNRQAKPWWPDSLAEVVSTAFHGAANVDRPARWAIDLARHAIAREEGEDLVNGAVFMLSRADLKRHGWLDWMPRAVARISAHDGNEFYFFTEAGQR